MYIFSTTFPFQVSEPAVNGQQAESSPGRARHSPADTWRQSLTHLWDNMGSTPLDRIDAEHANSAQKSWQDLSAVTPTTASPFTLYYAFSIIAL